MFPYPVLTLFLVVMWLLLNGFTLGHFILGLIVATFASWGMASLRPDRPKLKKWHLLFKLLFIALYDIIRSNIGVASVILRGRSEGHTSCFITVPLELEDRTALAFLAVILTSTPGSAWLEYNSNDRTVLLHVLDVIDEAAWVNTIKNRYEKLLMEIFA